MKDNTNLIEYLNNNKRKRQPRNVKKNLFPILRSISAKLRPRSVRFGSRRATPHARAPTSQTSSPVPVPVLPTASSPVTNETLSQTLAPVFETLRTMVSMQREVGAEIKECKAQLGRLVASTGRSRSTTVTPSIPIPIKKEEEEVVMHFDRSVGPSDSVSDVTAVNFPPSFPVGGSTVSEDVAPPRSTSPLHPTARPSIDLTWDILRGYSVLHPSFHIDDVSGTESDDGQGSFTRKRRRSLVEPASAEDERRHKPRRKVAPRPCRRAVQQKEQATSHSDGDDSEDDVPSVADKEKGKMPARDPAEGEQIEVASHASTTPSLPLSSTLFSFDHLPVVRYEKMLRTVMKELGDPHVRDSLTHGRVEEVREYLLALAEIHIRTHTKRSSSSDVNEAIRITEKLLDIVRGRED